MFPDFLFEVMQLTACNFQLTGNGENGPTTEIAVRLVSLVRRSGQEFVMIRPHRVVVYNA